jgi:hypothetical protein
VSGPSVAAWARATLVAVALVTLVGVLVACGSTAGEDEPGWLVRYERVWPDGYTERETVWPDGRVLMRHGEHLERLRLEDADVERLRVALEGDLPAGSPDDSPRRTVTLEGREPQPSRPEPGSATELLERLLDRHTLETRPPRTSPSPGSPAPAR